MLKDEFNMDEQREFINYLREYNFNYLIIKPYDEKYLYCVNKLFINESSLKTFVNNLHEMGIGIIFEFDTSSFLDYDQGLNDFDGSNIYNKIENKYDGVDRVYFDYNKNHTRSYVTSWVNYYMENFACDGYGNRDGFTCACVKCHYYPR